MTSEANHLLIQCGDHNWAPWSVVCVHLMHGQSTDWRPIPSTSPEVDFDWVCPECEPLAGKGEGLTEAELSKLGCVCIHCVRRLRKKYDPNYQEENNAEGDN